MPGSKVLHAQSREIIYEVYKYMKDEADYGVQNIKQVRNRVAAATNVSVQTIYRIIKEGKEIDGQHDKAFITPGLHRNRPKTKSANISEDLLNLAIISHHEAFDEYPTIKQLHEMLKEEGHFSGVKATLSSLLKNYGFKVKRVSPKKFVILEKKKCSHTITNKVSARPTKSTTVQTELNHDITETAVKIEVEDEESLEQIERVDIKHEKDVTKQNGFVERFKVEQESDEEEIDVMPCTRVDRLAVRDAINFEKPSVKEESYHHELILDIDPCELKYTPFILPQDHDYC